MTTAYQISLCWLRRDLRAEGHAALHQALATSRRVYCVFVFDRDLLDQLPGRRDRRVAFIHGCVAELQQSFERLGGGLIVRHGSAVAEIPALAEALGAQALYFNRDYEPEAMARDDLVSMRLAARGIACHSCKDQVIFEKNEVLTGDGRSYNVFTPYKNAWLKKLPQARLEPYAIEAYASRLAPVAGDIPALEQLGFLPVALDAQPGASAARTVLADFLRRIGDYHEQRDFPAADGTSRLSVHLRFGTISIRELVRAAMALPGPGPQAWLTELVWREFYQMLLYHYPRVVDHAFKTRFDAITWPGTDAQFAAWCEGRTGYPLVDAAMRQLEQSGWMHNRLRMVAASFLVKDLHVDWRRGERHFARKLLDYDLAANNGGWQWSASTGCDAQPWFRIFNPVTQSEKFDPAGTFIRRYVPELERCDTRFIHAPWRMPLELQHERGLVIGKDYPAPLVDHAAAREITLSLFKVR